MNKYRAQGLAIVFGAVLAAPAIAAPTGDAVAAPDRQTQSTQAAPTAQDQDVAQLIMELNQLEQRLAAIQRDTIVENPQLRTEARELQNLLVETMQEEGYSPNERLQRIQEIQTELSDPGLEPDRRQQLITEAQTEQQELSAAEQAALEHQDVQQAATEFEQRLVQAMKEQDPNAERLLQEYESRSEELAAKLQMPAQGQQSTQ